MRNNPGVQDQTQTHEKPARKSHTIHARRQPRSFMLRSVSGKPTHRSTGIYVFPKNSIITRPSPKVNRASASIDFTRGRPASQQQQQQQPAIKFPLSDFTGRPMNPHSRPLLICFYGTRWVMWSTGIDTDTTRPAQPAVHCTCNAMCLQLSVDRDNQSKILCYSIPPASGF